MPGTRNSLVNLQQQKKRPERNCKIAIMIQIIHVDLNHEPSAFNKLCYMPAIEYNIPFVSGVA